MTKRSFSGFEETQPSKQQREDTIIYSKMCELYGELLNDDGDNLPAIKEEERSETHEFFQCCQSKHEKEAIEGFHLVGFFKTCQCASFELRLAPDEASTVMDHVKNERRQKKFNDLFKIQPRFIQSDVLINRGYQVEIKQGSTVQMRLGPKPVTGLVLFGLFHGHPDLVRFPIRRKGHIAPFLAWASSTTSYTEVDVEHIGPIQCAIVSLENESIVNFHFPMLSTDPENRGQLKIGRQWKMIVLPVDEAVFKVLHVGKNDYMKFHHFLNIQVVKEARKNRILKKEFRSQEFEYPGKEMNDDIKLDDLVKLLKERINEEVLFQILNNILATSDLALDLAKSEDIITCEL